VFELPFCFQPKLAHGRHESTCLAGTPSRHTIHHVGKTISECRRNLPLAPLNF
jgi:hypothetical protein